MQERTNEQKLTEFETRVSRGEKVEPGDWMPDEYRKTLIRMIGQHAHSEIVGQLPEGKWIPYAPGFRRKLTLVAKVQDEAGHGQLLYRAAETLGKPREEMLDELLAGKAKYANVFNYPTPTWADVGVIGWLVDTAAVINQTMLAQTSYGPYGRAMKRICYEESFHIKQGYDSVVALAKGTPEQRIMAQDAINRWWYPTLMMSGPPDSLSTHTAQSMKWKIKTKTNEQVRQEFVDLIVPQIRALGMDVPDKECHLDKSTGHWHYTQPDWEELKRVVNGDGPMNKERLTAYRKAHEDGRWVREALAAKGKITRSGRMKDTQWDTYEVFHQTKKGDPHTFVGSVHAPDPQMALQMARDQFARRLKCASIWVVNSKHIIATDYQDEDFFAQVTDKSYRDPKAFEAPDKELPDEH